MWDEPGLRVSVDPAAHYVVACEANGNLTLAHRTTGALVLFAPDHALTGVTALPGSPPYSLMTIDAVPDLTSWIEAAAVQWSLP